MIFKYFLVALSLFFIYVSGFILTGKFYRWAYQSSNIFFEVEKEGRYIFSVFWFFTIPIYFVILLVYYPFRGLSKIHETFIEK